MHMYMSLASREGTLRNHSRCLLIRRREALKVKVTEDIINLLSDVRTFLQDKCEPPVYVSDRRLVKAVAIMQVRAYPARVARSSPHLLMHLRPEC